MLTAIAFIVTAGVALFIGYKWGSHEATNNAIEILESYTDETDLETEDELFRVP